MMNFLNRKFPTEKFPPFIIHIYYFLISFTFCYIYYHKFIMRADFHGALSSGGIYAVLNNEAAKPIQFRILVPYVFKFFKTLFVFIPDRALFFLLTIISTYFILLSFYFLLNEYFKSRAHNCWLAPIIIYPMIWNFVIMNGQFFYMDFTVLLFIILGFLVILRENYLLFLILFFIGLFNHPSVGYLIPAFLIFNYKNLLKLRVILFAVLLSLLYIVTYKIMDSVFTNEGYFIIYNLPRNLGLFKELPFHLILRDFFFNFGGLHFFILIFFFTKYWKRYRGPMLYVNLVIILYFISVLINFSVEEMRNYIAIIPFVTVLSLLFLSTFENSFLKLTEKFNFSSSK